MQRNALDFCRACSRLVLIACVICVGSAIGCGSGSQHSTAPVSGEVTYDGEPVTGGTLTFTPTGSGPEAGKSGYAEIQSDGTYTVSTYGDNDGAVIGPHEISYSSPTPTGHAEAKTESGEAGGSPLEGLVPKTANIEVTSGKNTVNIELVEPSN